MNERQHGRDHLSEGVTLAMGRGDVANYLGLEPETVSRALTQLEREHLIGRNGWGEIDILDGAGLIDRARILASDGPAIDKTAVGRRAGRS